ncbi:hypothetical protein EVAR_66574_1 [Eumeta japonica]|uniref:Uncharacterized protein n=1 Tax=Eumeta variegata TaxID=151549 RepID=A0A4C1Z4W2_EUMVA|nr:hypothetical protein EVAR_66574_1 [Eumeta japonica]
MHLRIPGVDVVSGKRALHPKLLLGRTGTPVIDPDPIDPNVNPWYKTVCLPTLRCGIPLELPSAYAVLPFFYAKFFSAQCG